MMDQFEFNFAQIMQGCGCLNFQDMSKNKHRQAKRAERGQSRLPLLRPTKSEILLPAYFLGASLSAPKGQCVHNIYVLTEIFSGANT